MRRQFHAGGLPEGARVGPQGIASGLRPVREESELHVAKERRDHRKTAVQLEEWQPVLGRGERVPTPGCGTRGKTAEKRRPVDDLVEGIEQEIAFRGRSEGVGDAPSVVAGAEGAAEPEREDVAPPEVDVVSVVEEGLRRLAITAEEIVAQSQGRRERQPRLVAHGQQRASRVAIRQADREVGRA
jgi:hypothetical protein